MRSKVSLVSIAILISLAVPSWSEESHQTYEVVVERAVKATMRDGVVLRADIYRPRSEGKFPVLLERTPYDKNGGLLFGMKAAAKGYVVIIQDVRGRYTSDGEWYVFKHESDDGYDTVEWAASLPFADGRVGMFGGSYVGATQMLAAIGHPPHLAGICPIVTASNYHNGWTYQGGAFEQWFNESWTSSLAQDTMNRNLTAATNARIGEAVLPLRKYPLFNSSANMQELMPIAAPYFLDWLDHPNYDDYWKRWSIEENYASIQVPALTVAAWYDIFQGGALRNYQGMRAKAGNESARNKQRLLVVIGGHAGSGRKIGDVDFGPAAEEFHENDVILLWYDYLFYGVKNRFAGDKPVRIFVMGTNVWRDEEAWPLARAQKTKYFLANGNAAGPAAAGLLSTSSAPGKVSESYVYDPMKPAPTTGGPLCCDSEHLAAGPYDQRPVEARADVLSYSTPVLTQDTEVTGPVTLELYAASSAVDTDFTAKLVDVWPNGYAQNLTEGIIRASYRDSATRPDALEPGKVYPFNIDLWSTSNVFLKGHRIRLEVSSSNFPRFDRNLNTGKSAANDQTSVKATNTIYHDAQHPSALILPLVILPFAAK
jgi:putative CocE/NonD family hydrolase